MATLPTNRSTSSTEQEHVDDHNELHAVHNDLQSLDGLSPAVVASGDLILIEDVSDSNGRRKVTAQDIANLGVGGSDGDAIHDNVAGEITPLTSVALQAADNFLIEDNSDSNNKKRATGQAIIDLVGEHNDVDAIHDDVAGEINAVTAKATPVSSDVLLIEDSAAGYAKKKITVGDLPSSGGGGAAGVTLITSTTYTVTEPGVYICDTDTAGGNCTVTLSLAASLEGTVTVKRNGANDVFIVTSGSDTFDLAGITQKTLFNDHAAGSFASPGSGAIWHELGYFGNVT